MSELPIHEERREGPRGEPDGLLYMIGQLSGEFKAFLVRYDDDQRSAREFRKFIREGQEALTERVLALETEEKIQAQPRTWIVWAIRISGGAAILAAANKLLEKVHWG